MRVVFRCQPAKLSLAQGANRIPAKQKLLRDSVKDHNMKAFLFFSLLTVNVMVSFTSQANNEHSSWQDLITTFEKAAAVCDGSCAKQCTLVATNLKKWQGLSQHKQQLKQDIMKCSGAFFMNKTARNSNNKANIGLLLMKSGAELPYIASAEQQSTPDLVKTNKLIPKVDTSIHNANGNLDMAKVQTLYSQTAQFCEPIIGGGPNDVMLRTCRDQCQQEAQKLNESIQGHSQALLNDKTATGLDIMRVKSNIVMHLNNVKRYLSDQATCIRVLQKGNHNKGDTPQIIHALVQAGNEVTQGKWPLKEKPSLSLAGLTKAKPIQLTMLAMKLRGKDATEQFKWESTVAQIKQYPEYKTMHQQVAKHGFSLDELKTAMTELNKVKDTAEKGQWQHKAEQFSDFGSMAELVAALNQPCDKNYLRQFKNDSLWLNPGKVMSFSPHPKSNNINYLIEPLYLQRLCYEKLHPSLVAEYEKANSGDALSAISAQYISQPPLSGGATCRDCPPRRSMHNKQWLPQAYAYLNKRNQQFAAVDQKNQQAQKQQDALLAKQNAEQNTANDTKIRTQSILEFVDSDYPTVIENSVLYKKPRKNMTEKDWKNAKVFFKKEAQYLAKLTTAKAKFSEQIIKQADKTHMLTNFKQLAEDVVLKNSQIKPNSSNRLILPEASVLSVTAFPNSRLPLSSLVACVGAAPLLNNFVKDPFQLSGEQFIYLENLLVECAKVSQQGTYQNSRQPGGNLQTDLYKSVVMPLAKNENHGYGIGGTLSFILSTFQSIDQKIRNMGLTTSNNKQQERFLMNVIDHHGIQYIQQLADKSFTNITGKTPEAIRLVAKQNFANKAKQVAQLKQQAKGQPLPTAPFKFDQHEGYVILDVIKRNNWLCAQKDIDEITNLDQFFANLHMCGFAAQDPQFKSFTEAYRKSHRTHRSGR